MNLEGRHEALGSRPKENQFLRTLNLEPRTSNLVPRTCSPGFTLIELVVVLAILALSAALVLPRLPASDATQLRSSARSLAATLRYLGERSVTAKTSYRLHLNLAEQTVTVTQRLASGDEVPPDDPFFKQRLLPGGITLTDVRTERLGTVRSGEVLVDFASRGLDEFLIIHLQTANGAAYTVTGYPGNGKVKVLAGYQEVTL